MVIKEITCVIIDREHVTNDPRAINRALLSESVVEYLSRTDVQRLAAETHRPEWQVLANTVCRVVVVNGLCYSRAVNEPPIEFSLSEFYPESRQ